MLYTRILMPVDLAHIQHLAKALRVAADLAKQYGAHVTYVGVTAPAPGPVAHNPREYKQKLVAFASTQAAQHGIATEARAYTAHDPATQIDETILKAISDAGADLVVMASHVPNVADYILPSHGGKVAKHADVSVFLVR